MRWLCMGEPLAEFTTRADTPSIFERRAGGDTLNTAIYLARQLPKPGQVGYLSRLGDDWMSGWLRDLIVGEGIADHMATQAGGRPGLSFISTDARGERSFVYWRDQAPARRLFSGPEAAAELDAVAKAPVVFLSAITLAILLPEGRERMLQALAQRQAAGGAIVLDTNYRPALWPDVETARQVIARAAGLASLILPSQDDMAACFGSADPAQAMQRLMAMGDAEIVLTTGGDSVLRRAATGAPVETFALPAPVAAVDTTGAGDSFNAAYLVARDAGQPVEAAVAASARLAARVVAYPGAIIPADAMPAL